MDEITTELTPLTDSEQSALRTGDGVRLVSPRGRIYEGFIERVRGFSGQAGRATMIVVGGRTFGFSRFTIYTIDPDHINLTDCAPLKPTVSQIIAAVTELSQQRTGSVLAVNDKNIADHLIGFDPTIMKLGRDYDGKSDDGWYNEFVSLSAIRNALNSAATTGEIRKVTYEYDGQMVSFNHRTRSGYVTTADFNAADSGRTAEIYERKIADLRAAASATVALRHTAEVDAEHMRLIVEAGL
jgi:hypothetical protein